MRRFPIKLTWLDIVIGSILLITAVYVVYRIHIGLNYKWNWSLIPQYLLRFDDNTNRFTPGILLNGLFTTIRLSFWASIGGIIIGTVFGLLRTSQRLFRRLLGATYVEFCRNLPPLVLIFIFYYFVSDQILPLLGLDELIRSTSDGTRKIIQIFTTTPTLFNAFLSGVIALALFEGAYIAEIVRAGIQSIGKDQWEASFALGFTKWQTMRHIIFPQSIPRILPPLTGQIISIIKDSAIVSVISIQDLTFQGLELMASTFLTFEIWITITLLYLGMTLCCSIFAQRIETRLSDKLMLKPT